MRDGLAEIERAVESCLPVRAYALSASDVVDRLDRVQAVSQRMCAMRLALVAEVEGRAVAAEQGASSTAAWLRERFRISPGAAARMVRLSRLVDTPGGQALADGVINAEQLT